jgi:bifunctional NMN adenylyltransferase/nudix hydrolase
MPQMHKYPTSFQATDIVLVNPLNGKVLLGRKPTQPKWRFMGGFVDPKDTSLEVAAERELQEEAGYVNRVGFPKYLFSFRVEDPRYATGPDGIMSAVFMITYDEFSKSKIKAGDDIGEVRWFSKAYLRNQYTKMIMPEHHTIIRGLIRLNVL